MVWSTFIMEEAHELATREPALDSPWPALTAYRLAHLVMRGARDDETLLRAEELFAYSARTDSESLGPLPTIYRLAAMHRLKAPPSQINDEFGRAMERLQTWNIEDYETRESRTHLQRGVFNLLELSSYFAGIPYEPWRE